MKNSWLNLGWVVIGALLVGCKQPEDRPTSIPPSDNHFISAVDISSFPEIAASATTFYDFYNTPQDFLVLLKQAGVNTIRLRLWVHPTGPHSGFDEVLQFSHTLKGHGFKTWIALHYSDTWADPSQQAAPKLWENLPFPILKDSVFAYTTKVAAALQPDFIQIGNEINNGFLHPLGSLGNPPDQFLQLLDTALLAVRQEAPQSKIVIHYAGITGADWFFNQLTGLDFDVIGLSYYPIWHGKSLPLLQQTLADLAVAHQKEIIIAETAYPFTLGWNDWTHNVVGTNDHLILPDFPATPAGQKAFLAEIRALVQSIPQGLGFCYWGAELVAWRGPAATNGSPWENQALFDFNHVALPALEVFGE